MPPTQNSTEETIHFLMLCLEHAPKPNFEKVGAGLDPPVSHTAAYKKLWAMQKKFKGSKGGTAAQSSPSNSSGKKRAAPQASTPKKSRKSARMEEPKDDVVSSSGDDGSGEAEG